MQRVLGLTRFFYTVCSATIKSRIQDQIGHWSIREELLFIYLKVLIRLCFARTIPSSWRCPTVVAELHWTFFTGLKFHAAQQNNCRGGFLCSNDKEQMYFQPGRSSLCTKTSSDSLLACSLVVVRFPHSLQLDQWPNQNLLISDSSHWIIKHLKKETKN